MTPRVRFLRAELAYGCHPEGAFAFPAGDEPVVIAGPNGSGKTTLVEALVRTLFGFNRRSQEDRDRLDARAPWDGGACRATIEIQGGDGRRWRVRRDFTDGRVEIEPLDGGEAWSGDGNPGASNQEAREYRARLVALFGLSEIEHYESTAWIVQGRLLEHTALGEDLLQIAAGGYGNVDDARARIGRRHEELTVRPIEGGRRTRRKDRALEEIEAEIERVGEKIGKTDAALDRRAPLQTGLDEARGRLDRLEDETRRLEAALGPLQERRAIEARMETIAGRRGRLDRARRRLRDAADALGAVRSDAARHEGERYPDDFLERTGRIETLWEQRDALETDRREVAGTPGFDAAPSVWPAALVGVGTIAGALVIGLVTGAVVPAAVLAVVGAAAAAWLESRRRSALDRRGDLHARLRRIDDELAEVARRLQRELDPVPRASTLSPATAENRKREFASRRAAAGRAEDARRALETAIAEAGEALKDVREGDGPPSEPGPGGDAAGRAVATLEACEDAIETLRTDLAEARIRLDGVARVELPEGVEPAPGAVERALEARREERRALERETRELERRLLEESTGHASPVALRGRLSALEARHAEILLEARTLEAAWALLTDAYEAFREGDQARLVGAVSAALANLTDGAIGPVEAPEALADPRVRLRGRTVPLDSPPLSYGEYHAALFAIRLGAADFLARGGIRPPLFVDEPFAYLDLDRARALWRTLRRIAAGRQVVVATQETLTLDALGVAPDLVLEVAARASL